MKLRILLLLIILLALSYFQIGNTYFAEEIAMQDQEPIKGIYVNAAYTQGPKFQQLLSLIKNSELNAVVIDIKDDKGHLTFLPSKSSPLFSASKSYISNPKELLKTLKANHIYPIARIVVFKDNVLAASHPNWSFRTARGIWRNARGESFTNPFVKEVWDYNIGAAIEAAQLGFKEIQFDYIRFPEKFETFEGELNYTEKQFVQDTSRNRVAAVTQFVKYARHKLKPYHIKLSADTFGNAVVIPEARGIGQNFSEIAQNVDVISSMIYPSHWTTIFGIKKPDLQPYRLLKNYAKVEKNRLKALKTPPVSRPWLQDFTAVWLGKGNYQVYGKKEIEAQIQALHSEGIDQFLLWNGASKYTPGVDYSPGF